MALTKSFDPSIHTNPPPLNSPVLGAASLPRSKPITLSNPKNNLVLNTELESENDEGDISSDPDQTKFDIALIERVLFHQPFKAKYGQRTIKWELIANELKANPTLNKRATMRSSRFRYNFLMRDFQERTKVNEGLKKLMKSKSTSVGRFKDLSEPDMLLLRILKITSTQAVRSPQSKKSSSSSSKSNRSNKFNNSNRSGTSSTIGPKEVAVISPSGSLPAPRRTSLPVTLPILLPVNEPIACPRDSQISPNSSSQSIFSENMGFYKTLNEVFSSDQEDYNSFDDDYDDLDEQFSFKSLPNLENWQNDYSSDQKNADELELQKEKMKWRWEYLELVKNEFQHKQLHRENKLKVLKELATAKR